MQTPISNFLPEIRNLAKIIFNIFCFLLKQNSYSIISHSPQKFSTHILMKRKKYKKSPPSQKKVLEPS